MGDNSITAKLLDEKIAFLRNSLSQHDRVAVAFSGGVDSTVLLHNCCKVFKPENILAVHARSCLQASSSIEDIEHLVAVHFSRSCLYHVVGCNPLEWPDFVMNTSERCYFCKKRTYTLLLEEAARRGFVVLLDGTNTDDLCQYRPGLKAVREHGVLSPLMESGFSKSEVRQYARREGLINHDLPSNSCLATRIRAQQHVTKELLAVIEDAEEFLRELGFTGVRVRPDAKSICIEIQEIDMPRFVEATIRDAVVQYFQRNGFGPVFLGLTGR